MTGRKTSAARGASRRAQPQGSASRCIGASRRVVRGNKLRAALCAAWSVGTRLVLGSCQPLRGTQNRVVPLRLRSLGSWKQRNFHSFEA